MYGFIYTFHIIVVKLQQQSMPKSSATNSTRHGRHELNGLGPIITTSRRSNQTQTQTTQIQVQPLASPINTEVSKREQKCQRRIREALKDLEYLGPIITTSRLRSRASQPNAEYIQSLHNAAADALPRGGLRTRSGHHYDRSF